MGERYVPKRQPQFLFLFQFILLIMFQMNLIVMGISRDNTIPSSVFWGWILGYLHVCVCVCVTCVGLEKIFI